VRRETTGLEGTERGGKQEAKAELPKIAVPVMAT